MRVKLPFFDSKFTEERITPAHAGKTTALAIVAAVL